MKILIAVFLNNLLYSVCRLFGRGSSLPGQIVLKLFPNIMSHLRLPETVIAVSGSNGKTSTVEMIAQILAAHGKKVIWNKEGSNQIEGVATLLLRNATLKGIIKADVVLIESDERYSRLTFRQITPSHFVITNLYRDQMTRNAHREWIFDILSDAILDQTCLILNADDPLVCKFGYKRANTVYFSVDENLYSTKEPRGVYNDGKYCPVCGEPLSYDYYNMVHLGRYSCTSCDFHSGEPLCRLTDMDLENKTLIFDNEYRINITLASAYNAYNLLAAFTLAALLGLDKSVTADALNGYLLKNGRVVTFRLGDHDGMLLTSKHENSVSYNQSIDYVARFGKGSTVLFLVDAISRKYYTSETSWLYDIDFDGLNDAPDQVILSGRYCHDLALRFSFTSLPGNKIVTEPSITKAADLMRNAPGNNRCFVITCFSDKDKFLTLLDKTERTPS